MYEGNDVAVCQSLTSYSAAPTNVGIVAKEDVTGRTALLVLPDSTIPHCSVGIRLSLTVYRLTECLIHLSRKWQCSS
jgi:hypothetical protein